MLAALPPIDMTLQEIVDLCVPHSVQECLRAAHPHTYIRGRDTWVEDSLRFGDDLYNVEIKGWDRLGMIPPRHLFGWDAPREGDPKVQQSGLATWAKQADKLVQDFAEADLVLQFLNNYSLATLRYYWPVAMSLAPGEHWSKANPLKHMVPEQLPRFLEALRRTSALIATALLMPMPELGKEQEANIKIMVPDKMVTRGELRFASSLTSTFPRIKPG